jgi:hypothetical protein
MEMTNINAIFVNRKDVLDETSEQYHICTDIMSLVDKENLSNFNDNSFMVVPYSDSSDDSTSFYIILRDTNVNCEAFFNGIYGLYLLIKQGDPGMLDYISINGINIVLNQITEVEEYVTPEMIEKMFSIIFNGR